MCLERIWTELWSLDQKIAVVELHDKCSDFLDYIPSFDGNKLVEITPPTQDQWQDLDLELHFRPSKQNGVLYHAERRHGRPAEPDENQPTTSQRAPGSHVFHNLALRRGHLVYTFDVGTGVGRVQAQVPVNNMEWHKVRVRNDPTKGMRTSANQLTII